MARIIREIEEREYNFLKEKLLLFERFFHILEIQTETHKKVVNQIIDNKYLSDLNFHMDDDMKRQKEWIRLLENVVPKDVKKKLLDRHKHIFHIPSGKYMDEDIEEL